ncbi:MAG: phage protein [Sporomusaceae bacterium]|nr:phage protein [Sporomusaceae bacterium]
MKHSTYSFTDLTATISHPSYGAYSIQGEGIGDLTVSKLTDRSVQNIAADGSVMTSKIAGNNGTVTINAQQTSSLHNFLQGMFNYLWSANTDEWDQISLTVRAPKMQKTYYCTGGAFVKEPDEPFQAQGQLVPWPILFADIQRLPI